LQRPWVIRSRRSAENAQGLAKILEILLRNRCFARKRKKRVLVYNGRSGFIVGVGAAAAVKTRWFIDMAVGRRVKAKTGATPKPRRTPCVSTAGNRLKSGGEMAGVDSRRTTVKKLPDKKMWSKFAKYYFIKIKEHCRWLKSLAESRPS